MTWQLLLGDASTVLQGLYGASPLQRFALAYLDPPFCTGRDFRLGEEVAFSDRWASESEYVASVASVAIDAWCLLMPGGSLVLHVDPRMSHRLRVALDAAFGDTFASEIVWRYRRWPSKTPNFQRVHDVLLRWVKPGAAARWNQLYEPLAASTQATWGTRKQRAVVDGTGRRRRSSTTEEASPGVPMGDVWDVPIVAPVAKERTGYPTQKPEALLRRLVEALTLPGDAVLEPYAGSATASAVAVRLGRRAVAIDRSPVAHRVATARLEAIRGHQ